jgi:2'-5' RNA ligase
VRLFTAAVPPPRIADHLAEALAGVPMTYRVAGDAWHITIGYYGEESAEDRIPWVRARLDGCRPPRISLGDMGNFGATLLMTVADPAGDLAALGAALRWDDKHPEYNPHLTIGKGEVTALGYRGPEWTVDEVVLLGAEQRHEYTVLARFPLV